MCGGAAHLGGDLVHQRAGHGARHQQDARRRYGHKAKMTKMTDMTEMTQMTCALLNALQIKDERKAFRVGDI